MPADGDEVQRFAKFLTFPSLGDRSTPDHIAPGHQEHFEAMLDFLETSFPDVYSHLTVEKVGEGTHFSAPPKGAAGGNASAAGGAFLVVHLAARLRPGHQRSCSMRWHLLAQVGVDGWSRLYTWHGSDSSLAPVLFISHYDVVPAPNEGERKWKHGPFDGKVVDG